MCVKRIKSLHLKNTGIMKRKLLITLASLTLVINAQAQQTLQYLKLSDEDKIEGLSTVWSGVKYNFVFYDKLTFDWDSLYRATIPKILKTKNAFEYYRELQRMCAMLKDGHTGIYMNYDKSAKENWHTTPYRVKSIENRIFISEALNDELIKAGVKEGVEILKIDGLDVQEYIKTYIDPYISSSTPQFLTAYCSDICKIGENHLQRLVLKDQTGKIFEYTISRKLSENDRKRRGTFEFKKLKGNIGLLKINRFWLKDFNEQFDTLYSQILDTDALVIDIRNNPGGQTEYSDYVMRHLSETPMQYERWTSRMYIPAHAAWNRPAEWYNSGPDTLRPINKKIYTKPVILLVNESTYSSAEDFCTIFRGAKRGLILGVPTAGSSGNPIDIDLPGGGSVYICTKHNTYPDGTQFVGIGIIPDIEVKETVESWRNKQDLALEKALEVFKTKYEVY